MKKLISKLALFITPSISSNLKDGVKAYEEFDYVKAYKIFSKEQLKDDKNALFYLGNMYLKGEFVEKDIDKAIEFFEKSVNNENIESAFILVNLYLNEKEIEKDIEKAKYWLKHAASKNYLKAKEMLFELEFGKKEQEISFLDAKDAFLDEDYKKALEFFLILARKDDIVAQYYIGYIYEYCEIEAENKDSFCWFLKSANGGYSEAQYEVALKYYFENQCEDAVLWYEKAARQNHKQAQHNLALMFELGYGVEKNQELANLWYKKSKEKENNI